MNIEKTTITVTKDTAKEIKIQAANQYLTIGDQVVLMIKDLKEVGKWYKPEESK